MMRFSGCWPTLCSTSSWRIEALLDKIFGRGLVPLSLASAAAVAVSLALVFFYAPIDADQGFIQKIFYVHVPMAIVALVGFVAAGLLAIAHLRTRDEVWDHRSYVAIHISVIFGVGVLATGAIWAKASWGKWWVWDEPTLVSFLIVFLLYATYYPLRYSIEDPGRRARYASVFAVTAGAFVPVNFIAVRLAENLVHPRVLNATAGDMPGEMRLTFLVSLLAISLLYLTLMKLELSSKHARAQLKRLRTLLEAEPPAGAAATPLATVPARPTYD
jgi:heme exporter protein C